MNGKMEKVKNKISQFLSNAYDDSDDSDSESEELNPNNSNNNSQYKDLYNNIPYFIRRGQENETIAQRIRQSQSTNSLSPENQSLLSAPQPLIVHRRKSSIAMTR